MSVIIPKGVSFVYESKGAPSAGTDEVETITFGGTPTGGTFKLAFQGATTAAISWSATNATLVANIDAALEALATIGTGNVTTAVGTMTAGIGTITVTFGSALGKLAVSTMTVAANNLTGTSPTIAIAKTTPGVTATARGYPKGTIVSDTTNAKGYIMATGGNAPTFTVLGTQT